MSSAACTWPLLLLLASLGLDIGPVLGAGGGGGGGRVTLLVGGAVQRQGAECDTGQIYLLQYRGYSVVGGVEGRGSRGFKNISPYNYNSK